MKTFSLLTLSSLLIFLAFKPATETFKVDTEKSSIEWVAGKVGGSHKGTIGIALGKLDYDGKALKGGSFAIDMTSIVITDLQGNSNKNLLNHLKGDDFFSVAKHPSATFEITKITPDGTDRVNITGNLSIKGISNSITFPATVKRQKNVVVAVAKGVKVDRTKYDIKYRSKSFFGDIGDKAIDDEFELSINLVATK
ncbi:YceI family protein [Paradesertivirga mongoliensis]|uniref:YceI family protein n=1 Tax=Paradesertivirga mongoliensis TaxID=2100740 RepID=A0ABW4ZGI5_9SPHI|nr:YceI family protein [Pedobacter mongoliensis]